MDTDGITRPQSVDAAQMLMPYCGGFMSVDGKDHRRMWALLKTVSPEQGIFVEAFCYEDNLLWYYTKDGCGISFPVQGIMVYDRGGEFEFFGDVVRDKDCRLIHVYTPVDRLCRNSLGETPSVNYFYYPESKMVPEKITSSYRASRSA